MHADMHVHTTCSDGLLSPRETTEEAARVGLRAVGIADHDTLLGMPEAQAAASRLNIEVIPAVELSADQEHLEVHILAYYPGDALEDTLQELRAMRLSRMHEMITRLAGLGVSVPIQRVLEIAGSAAPGRPHLARAMEEEGHVSKSEAFDRYLAKGRPAYVGRVRPSPGEAVTLIREAGGIPVLAHPGSHLDELAEPLLRRGLMGIEAYHPSHTEEDTARCLQLCRRMGLLVTGGSDSHGPGTGRPQIGEFTVPYHLVERLKEVRR